MKLSAPKRNTFYVGVALLVLALLGNLKIIDGLTQYDFWLAMFGGVVLALGAYVKGF